MLIDTFPAVSVVINCYNGARYLREALDSVVAQTWSDWEVVFWDNQSADSSREIFETYTDPRFRYFYADRHMPLGDARNLAVAQARGEWIAFLDCDDYWSPDKLARQMDIVRNSAEDVGLVYGRADLVLQLSGGKQRKVLSVPRSYAGKCLPEGDIFSKLLMENFIPLVTALVKRSVFNKCGGFPAGYKQAEDYVLFLRISKSWRVAAVQDICCTYRIHGGNLSFSQKRLGLEESLRAVLEISHPNKHLRAIKRHYTALGLFMIWEGEWGNGGWLLASKGSLLDVLFYVRGVILNRFSLLLHES